MRLVCKKFRKRKYLFFSLDFEELFGKSVSFATYWDVVEDESNNKYVK